MRTKNLHSFDRRSHFCQAKGEALVKKTEFFGVYIGMQVFFGKSITFELSLMTRGTTTPLPAHKLGFFKVN